MAHSQGESESGWVFFCLSPTEWFLEHFGVLPGHFYQLNWKTLFIVCNKRIRWILRMPLTINEKLLEFAFSWESIFHPSITIFNQTKAQKIYFCSALPLNNPWIISIQSKSVVHTRLIVSQPHSLKNMTFILVVILNSLNTIKDQW